MLFLSGGVLCNLKREQHVHFFKTSTRFYRKSLKSPSITRGQTVILNRRRRRDLAGSAGRREVCWGFIVPEMNTQATDVIAPSADFDGWSSSCLDFATSEIKAFVASHDLAPDAERVEQLARKIFPAGSTMAFEMARDRESDAEWLVFRVTLAGTAGEVLPRYSKLLDAWIAIASPQAINHITLSYAIV
jgi:hypothetical protein